MQSLPVGGRTGYNPDRSEGEDIMRYGWISVVGLLLSGCVAVLHEEKAQYAPEPPPPERAEISGPPESPGAVWITGRWSREANDWAWEPGFYARPPAPNRVWIPGRWTPFNDTSVWAYTPGAWAPLREIQPLDLSPLAVDSDGSPLLSLGDFLTMERPR
jgi:hypothetical protein